LKIKRNIKKSDIVQRFIGQPIEKFESFFKIYNKIQSEGFYAIDNNEIEKMIKNSIRLSLSYCDVCGKQNLQNGDHYKCEQCEDYDLCSTCKVKGNISLSHVPSHTMKAL